MQPTTSSKKTLSSNDIVSYAGWGRAEDARSLCFQVWRSANVDTIIREQYIENVAHGFDCYCSEKFDVFEYVLKLTAALLGMDYDDLSSRITHQTQLRFQPVEEGTSEATCHPHAPNVDVTCVTRPQVSLGDLHGREGNMAYVQEVVMEALSRCGNSQDIVEQYKAHMNAASNYRNKAVISALYMGLDVDTVLAELDSRQWHVDDFHSPEYIGGKQLRVRLDGTDNWHGISVCNFGLGCYTFTDHFHLDDGTEWEENDVSFLTLECLVCMMDGTDPQADNFFGTVDEAMKAAHNYQVRLINDYNSRERDFPFEKTNRVWC